MIKKTNKGFILIEILVSLVVFAVGVLFLVQSISLITKSNQHIRDNASAWLLVDNILNRLYSGEYIQLMGIETIRNRDFKWAIDQADSLDGLKQILLKVTWQSRGINYSVNLDHSVLAIK